MELNEEICEFIGAFIGDGYMGNYGKRKNIYVIGFSGDQTLDESYFKDYLIPLIKRNFPYTKPHLYYRKNEHTIVLVIYSKKLFRFMGFFGFSGGVKAKTVKIPENIFLNKESHIKATLRGLFDTDGSIYFDKRPSYKSHYPRIELHLHNPGLIKMVHLLLKKFSINGNMNQNRDRIQINGHENVQDFIKKVGFSNQRHIKKIKKIRASAEI